MRLFAACLLALSACKKTAENAHAERRQSMEGLTLSQSEKGTPAWTLKSRYAILHEDEQRAALTEPLMEFYKEGRAVSRVTALSGDVETETHDVRLSSSVVFDSFEDQSRLTTTELLYDSKRGLFTTQADVLIRRPDGVLHGRGLEAKPDMSEIRIFNQNSVMNGTSR